MDGERNTPSSLGPNWSENLGSANPLTSPIPVAENYTLATNGRGTILPGAATPELVFWITSPTEFVGLRNFSNGTEL
jgi:hypothetical protein